MTPLVRVRSVKPATDGEHAPADDAASGNRFLEFDDLYRQEYAAVVRLAFALTGRLGLAEEMAQDAFLSAYRAWDRIGHYENPGAWLRRVVTNRGVSAWRRALTEARLVARL